MGEKILIRKRFHWICYSQLFKNNARIGWCLWRAVCFKNICYRDMVYLAELLQMFRVILNPLTMVLLYLDVILLPWWNIFLLDIIQYYRDRIFSTVISFSTTVMEHFLPLHHFTMEHFLPWDHFTIYRDINIFYLDSILLPWWNIFYLDIILPP